MRRVLSNLISNALKFTKAGTVTLSMQRLPPLSPDAECNVLLSIADTGPGIAPEEHERVFEDFYQVDNPSRDRSQGLGLGLSIVKRTAALLGISVSMHSALGVGTRFDLMIASCEPPDQEPEPRGLEWLNNIQGDTLDPNARVLAIDDEPEILESLSVMLPHFGCEVRCAPGLARALEVLDSGFVPEVLLVDHRLNGESGSQVIAALRERLGPVPAVVVTGDTAPHDLQRALGSGTRVIHKPIDGLLLAQALAESLNGPV